MMNGMAAWTVLVISLAFLSHYLESSGFDGFGVLIFMTLLTLFSFGPLFFLSSF